VQKLNTELRAVLAEPDIRAKLEQQGAEPAPMEQAAFAKLIRDDVNKWGDLIRAAGIQPE
jgi:tripartite-type tricarboxylate transporter receptor subunit TctC